MHTHFKIERREAVNHEYVRVGWGICHVRRCKKVKEAGTKKFFLVWSLIRAQVVCGPYHNFNKFFHFETNFLHVRLLSSLLRLEELSSDHQDPGKARRQAIWNEWCDLNFTSHIFILLHLPTFCPKSNDNEPHWPEYFNNSPKIT